MNYIISDLMEECEGSLSTESEPYYDMEKFAKLVALECVKVVDAQKGIWPDGVPVDVILDMIEKNIKVYFGAE